jgi:membrane protein
MTGIFTIGKTLLAFYFSMANPASVYGVAGARHFNLIMGFLLFHDFVFELNLRLPTPKIYTGIVPPTAIAKGIVHSKKI